VSSEKRLLPQRRETKEKGRRETGETAMASKKMRETATAKETVL
jgi:hypothetical protein